jgi:hypothetical protein
MALSQGVTFRIFRDVRLILHGGPEETGIPAAGGQCGMTDGYVHPAYPNGARSTVQPSGSPVNPYSTAPPPSSTKAGCNPTTGT